MYRSQVLICGGTGCTSSNSRVIADKLAEELKLKGIDEEVKIVMTGCFGLCERGPIMIVYPEGSFYSMVNEEDIPEIVSEHLANGKVVTRLLYQETVKENELLLEVQKMDDDKLSRLIQYAKFINSQND